MASRSQRYLLGLVTGYGSIAANIVFTIVSIPLALHYLGKAEFGLWALATQINGYLQLIDLGINGAVSRFVADHKDDVNGGEYGTCLLTGGLVFLVQGLVVLGVGLTFSSYAPEVFAIPEALRNDFSGLLTLLAWMMGVGFVFRAISSPLWAFQRFDVINLCSTAALLLGLLGTWIGFKAGLGVYALAVAQIPQTLLAISVYFWICIKNGYYPKRGFWGRPDWKVFKTIFKYGQDIMLLAIGNQLINGSQIVVISRVLGLEAAATFSVGTKLYTMAMQLVGTLLTNASPGLTELYVRGEMDRFVQRFRDLIAMILGLATLAAVCFTCGNTAFLSFWVGKQIAWSWREDLLLAVLILLKNLSGVFVGMFGTTKNLTKVRYIYLLEGLIFVPLAFVTARFFGIAGVLIASIISHFCVTFLLSGKAATSVIGDLGSMKTQFLAAFVFLTVTVFCAWFGLVFSWSPITKLISTAVLAGLCIPLIWHLMLDATMKNEISKRIKNLYLRVCRG